MILSCLFSLGVK